MITIGTKGEFMIYFDRLHNGAWFVQLEVVGDERSSDYAMASDLESMWSAAAMAIGKLMSQRLQHGLGEVYGGYDFPQAVAQ